MVRIVLRADRIGDNIPLSLNSKTTLVDRVNPMEKQVKTRDAQMWNFGTLRRFLRSYSIGPIIDCAKLNRAGGRAILSTLTSILAWSLPDTHSASSTFYTFARLPAMSVTASRLHPISTKPLKDLCIFRTPGSRRILFAAATIPNFRAISIQPDYSSAILWEDDVTGTVVASFQIRPYV